MKKTITTAALAAIVALSAAPSHSAANLVVAGPVAAVANYTTTRVVVTTTAPATFVNLDPAAPHDVVSFKTKRVGNKDVPVFKSDVEAVGGTSEIVGLAGLAPGDYGFYCSIHPNMTGTITLV